MIKPTLERWLERGLFASRWLMAPFYVGLVISLGALLVMFFQELIHELPHVVGGQDSPEDAILMALSLIDLSLAGNLVLIVIFSGYENFVSKIDTASHEDRPDWMGAVNFSQLKLKLMASIVAISAVALLRGFLGIADGKYDERALAWMVGIHFTFVVSGVLMALTDLITNKSSGGGKSR